MELKTKGLHSVLHSTINHASLHGQPHFLSLAEVIPLPLGLNCLRELKILCHQSWKFVSIWIRRILNWKFCIFYFSVIPHQRIWTGGLSRMLPSLTAALQPKRKCSLVERFQTCSAKGSKLMIFKIWKLNFMGLILEIFLKIKWLNNIGCKLQILVLFVNVWTALTAVLCSEKSAPAQY